MGGRGVICDNKMLFILKTDDCIYSLLSPTQCHFWSMWGTGFVFFTAISNVDTLQVLRLMFLHLTTEYSLRHPCEI